MKLATMIKNAREKKEWTKTELAQAIGVTPGFITKVESGKSFPSYELCLTMANVLGLSFDELWTEVEKARTQASTQRKHARSTSRLKASQGQTAGKMPPAGKTTQGQIPVVSKPPPLKDLAPFIAGPPITHPARFFGRGRELKRLLNLWNKFPLQNAAIIGQRRSGKTSLLHFLRNITIVPPEELRDDQRNKWLPELEPYRFIFVDFQDPRFGSQEVLLRYLLDGLDLSANAPDPCDLVSFIGVVSRGLDTPTVILMDEIDVALQRYPELDDSFWEGLRSLITNSAGGKLALMLVAEAPLDQLITSSPAIGSPFLNIFGYTTSLGALTDDEARGLIASSPIDFSEADVEWIVIQSGRWPLLLQILCRECLAALEYEKSEGKKPDYDWREEGLHQIGPFLYLLENREQDNH